MHQWTTDFSTDKEIVPIPGGTYGVIYESGGKQIVMDYKTHCSSLIGGHTTR